MTTEGKQDYRHWELLKAVANLISSLKHFCLNLMRFMFYLTREVQLLWITIVEHNSGQIVWVQVDQLDILQRSVLSPPFQQPPNSSPKLNKNCGVMCGLNKHSWVIRIHSLTNLQLGRFLTLPIAVFQHTALLRRRNFPIIYGNNNLRAVV